MMDLKTHLTQTKTVRKSRKCMASKWDFTNAKDANQGATCPKKLNVIGAW